MDRKIQIGFLLAGTLLLMGCQKDERVGSVPNAPEMPAVPGASAPKDPGPETSNLANTSPAARGTEVMPPTVVAPPPTPPAAPVTLTIPLDWTKLATLDVEGYPDKTAQVEVAVQGRGVGKDFVCEIPLQHERYKTDAKWSPLPLVLYNTSQPNEGLAPDFKDTLFFPADQRSSTESSRTFLVEFTRGHLFRALWRLQAKRYRLNEKPLCRGQLELCLSVAPNAEGKYQCTGKWKELKRLVTHINTRRWVTEHYKPVHQRNDLVRLELQLRELDPNGYPIGDTQSEDVPGFE